MGLSEKILPTTHCGLPQVRGQDGNRPSLTTRWHAGPAALGLLLQSCMARGGGFLPARLDVPVSVYPCSVCKARRPGKLASAYWAWFRADGVRTAYKVRYCQQCAYQYLVDILAKTRQLGDLEDVFACVSCGISAEGDSDPIYLTLYLPGKEPEELALQLCGACAAKMRGPITDSGDHLEDRGGVVRGPSPNNSSWDALAIPT